MANTKHNGKSVAPEFNGQRIKKEFESSEPLPGVSSAPLGPIPIPQPSPKKTPPCKKSDKP